MATGEESDAACEYKYDRVEEQEDHEEEALHRHHCHQILLNTGTRFIQIDKIL